MLDPILQECKALKVPVRSGPPGPAARRSIPGICYHAAVMPEYSIGVDLGGTNLRAAAIDRNGKILNKVEGSTQLSAGRDAVTSDIVASVLRLKAAVASKRLIGIGIGVPGFIIMDKGVISISPNLPGFENFAIRDEIERLLQAPVLLENDANVAALGEKWIGAGRDVDDLVLLTLGTGIGGGIISGGKVLHGFVGMAGEIGHMTVIPEGNPCACGSVGCLEKHASATAITAMARMLGLGRPCDVQRRLRSGDRGRRQGTDVFRADGVLARYCARKSGEYFQFSALFAQRRSPACVGPVRTRDAR